MTRFTDKLGTILHKPFLGRYSTLAGLWALLGVIAWATKYFPGKYNNFSIFRQSFWHALERLPLYPEYPAEYFDSFHYGPVFSLVVAPFALLPVWAGLLGWLVAQSLFLWWAVRALPSARREHIFIYWFCAHELLTALFMSQFNISTAAMILLSYACIEKGRDGWAAFWIVLGTFVKLYGIVGLAFIFFSRHKRRLLLACAGWAALLFVAPMCLGGAGYVVGEYEGWYHSLVEKNALNLFADKQNISLLGMIRKISGSEAYPDLYPIAAGLLLFGLPYSRRGQYAYEGFRKASLASALLFVVLFSTGSESSTYIIALIGVAIWYVSAPWKRSRADMALMAFAFLLTSMSPSDLFPRFLKERYIFPYALKALPCAIIWLKLACEMYRCDYNPALNKTSHGQE